MSETRELTATATVPSPDLETGGRVLIVCRSPELRLYIQKSLAVGELDSTTVVDLGEARDLLSSGAPFRAVLVELDDPLPPGAAKALERFCGDFRATTVVGIAPKPSAELVRDAMAGGVQDFLTNPFNTREMAQALRRALESAPRRAGAEAPAAPASAEQPPAPSKAAARETSNGPAIVTDNAKMRRILEIVDRVAPTDSTVLIEGESGTGKELIAKRIHGLSRRSQGPFVEVHCGAIPAALLESQLFGHERGSFTGAVNRQIGLFEIANHGTIFLDEIAEMNLDMQVKLLRVLQECTFRRIGGKDNVKLDVRVVAATNRDLKTEVETGRFRADLFFRLNVIALKMTPLRERLEDIPALVQFFLERFQSEKGLPPKRFHPELIEHFQRLRWVGNIRELENVVERLLLLSPGEVVERQDLQEGDLPFAGSAGAASSAECPFTPTMTLDEVKSLHISHVLRANSGNKMKTARVLGINIKTLYNLIQRLKIPAEGARSQAPESAAADSD